MNWFSTLDWTAITGFVTAIGVLIKTIIDKDKHSDATVEALNEIRGDIIAIKEELASAKELTSSNTVGIRNIHRYRLQHDIQRAIVRGYTTVIEFSELSHLYESYVSLGGNGVITALYDRFKELEVRKEEQI